MKRIALIVRRHRAAALAALAILVVAGSVAAFSGATFNYKTANPANTFTAGNLHHTNSLDGAAILSASGMKPGDTATGTVVITNDGDIDGTFSLLSSVVSDVAGPNGGKLGDVLQVKVVKDGTTTVVDYPTLLKNFASTAVNEGTFAVSASHSYVFTVKFPDGGTPGSNTTGDNAYKGAALTMRYDWTEL